MNFAVQQHRKLTEVLPVPEGLRELMADITREVLRYQPEKIEAFIADYLESMLLTRELYQIASQTVDDVVESSFQIVEVFKASGMSQEKAESSVEVIRDEFKSHLTEIDEIEPLRELDIVKRLIKECHLTVEEAEKASEVIESAWMHFYNQNKSKVMKITPDFAHDAAVKNTLSVYQKSPKVNDTDLQRASKILDTGFQGYFKRKFQADIAQGLVPSANWEKQNFEMRENAVNKIKSWYHASKVRNDFVEKKKAAVKIQANFKGYRERKNLKTVQFEENFNTISSIDEESLNFNEEAMMNEAARKIQSHYRKHISNKDSEHKQKAATIIQARFRGYMTRKIRTEMNYWKWHFVINVTP